MNQKSQINIKEVEGLELYCKLPGQTNQQPCYIELDCARRELSAAYNAEVGNAVPMSVHDGHVRRWAIPALRANVANRMLEEIATYAEIICDAYTPEFDGHTCVAVFTKSPKVREAYDAISDACEQAISDAAYGNGAIQVWHAVDYFASVGWHESQASEIGITANTTDAELETLAESWLRSAQADGVESIEGLSEHLRMLRDEMLEMAE